jgi:lipoprotein-releasing system permease protein
MVEGALDHLDHPEKILERKKPSKEGASRKATDAEGKGLKKGAAKGGSAPEENKPTPMTKSQKTALDEAIALAVQGTEAAPDGEIGSLPGIVIGKEMARSLKVFVGDVLNVVSPASELGPTGPVPKSRAFRVGGIFYSGMYEYDSKFVYISLFDAQSFFNLKGAVTGIEYKVDDIDSTQGISQEMMRLVGGYPYRTKDWMEMNRNLFSALKLEKIAMFIILTLTIFMASFLILVTLIMVVLEKGKEIAILKSMGATDTSIMKVFVTYGLVIGVIGAGAGLTMGLGLCGVIQNFGIGLDPEVYYITHLPVKVDTFEVSLVGIAAVIVSYLATIPPALFAARLEPVEGLRYE